MTNAAPLVLIVDDTRDTAELYSLYLRAIGLRADMASSCAEGVAKARSVPPDLILLDLHMPDVSGIECIEPFRELQECQSIPIIAFTADSTPETRTCALEAGFEDVITKPCFPDAVAAIVKAVLAKAPSGRSTTN